MKKTTIKRIILLGIIFLITLMCLLPIVNSNDNVTYTPVPFYTYVTDNGTTKQKLNQKVIDVEDNDDSTSKWSDIGTVYAKGNGENKVDGKESAYGHTLSQYNVFCIEPGEQNLYGAYAIDSEVDCRDNILTYILYKAANRNDYSLTNIESSYRTVEQLMLWKYLASNKQNGINDSITYNENVDYTVALNYANNLTAFEGSTYNPTISIEEDSNDSTKLKITINAQDLEYMNYSLSYKVNGGTATTIDVTKGTNVYYISKGSGTVEVTLKETFTKYYVKYRKLTRAEDQNLLVVTNIGTENIEKEAKASITTGYDVSMQKYIREVKNGAGEIVATYYSTVGEVTVDTRANQNTDITEPNYNIINTAGNSENNIEPTFKSIYKEYTSSGSNVISGEGYKRNDKFNDTTNNNAVPIEVGDSVTYRIYVYNNEEYPAQNIKVIERLPYYFPNPLDTEFEKNDNKKTVVKNDTSDVLIQDESGNPMTWTRVPNTTYGCIDYEYVIDELDAKASTHFDVTLTFDKYLEGIFTNTAFIQCDNNITEYRTVDRDYVQMKKYAVSLEKFVSKVEDAQGNVIKDLGTEREGKRFNVTYTENPNENYVTEKPNNKVEVEIGDYVTYTIRLKNTGDSLIKVNQIYDLFTNVDGKKLTFDPTYGVKKKVNDTTYEDVEVTINDQYKGPNDDWTEVIESVQDDQNPEVAQIYEITFATPITLANEDDYVDLTIRFKVEVSQANSAQTNYLCNRAGVIDIFNRNDINVMDSDNHSNNADMDFVETRTYAVSLEKYVSKVVEAESDGKIRYYEREGKAEHRFDNNFSEPNRNKFDNPVPVKNGNEVTYIIKVINDGESRVTITNIADYLPNGVRYGENLYVGDRYCTDCENSPTTYDENGNLVLDNGQTVNIVNYTNNIVLEPGESKSLEITVTVTEPDISQNLLKNVAEIISMKNRNGLDVNDTTGNNNKDADYIVLDYDPILVDIIAEKVWYDNDNVAGIRPGSIQVQLYKNGVAEGSSVTLNAGNNWSYTWKDLYMYDNKSKNENVYTVKEVNVPNGYTVEYEINNNKTIIKNSITSTSVPVSKTVIKVWDDNNNILAKRPEHIEVQLYKDGVAVLEENGGLVILNAGNNWTCTWTGLEAGHRYTVDEVNVPNGYYKNITESENITTITNTIDKPDPIAKTVEKVWDDNDNAAGTRPENIQVQLYKNGVAEGSSVTLHAGNNWSYKWDNLEAGMSYTVEEVVPNGYSVNYSSEGDTFIITNILNSSDDTTDPEYISKTVEKRWNDNNNAYGKRPDSIEVQLYKNGIAEGNVVTLSAEKDWKHTWNNLADGATYTVREMNVPEGYISTYGEDNGKIIIRNTFEDVPSSPDVIIGGYVWNDKALNKTQDNYNGILDSEQENILEGIKVYLYRVGVDKAVSVKYTNSNGYYSFANTDIDKTVVKNAHEQYIKGPKVVGTNRWVGTYYSYYVVFEYDGVTYTFTATPNGQSSEDIINSSKDYHIDSNAKEDNGKVSITRENFNNKFNPINNAKGINYTTKNEEGFIPQSNHVYDSTTMAMQSSTDLINFENLLNGLNYNDESHLSIINQIEDKLKYVGLGLRGRDIFDLELTSDVDNIKVTVNNEPGVYKYSNKVTLRKADLNPNSATDEDMANKVNEVEHTYVDSQEQKIRETDLDVTKTGGTGYTEGVQNIEVTYKITVQNTSRTAGTATIVTNYYDDAYTFVKAYAGNSDLSSTEGDSGTGYKSVEIETPEIMLNQSETMDIYVVYTLNNPAETLKHLTSLPTFNMAEITEYRTGCGNGQTEYTRGLIDKDSAPGSVNSESVRLHPNAIGEQSTVDYYFGGNDLSVLKYEDDTYATPTLYFVKDDSMRTIEGTVFEDKTTTDSATKIKTGNGKLDKGEVGVYGATVELIEQVGDGVVRYSTSTNKDGYFKFEGFLPGNYIIKYWYGDTVNTVLKNQYVDNEGNKYNEKSYNGEDFQATNNIGTHGALKLNNKENFWYVYNENEGISTAKDNSSRREDVSKNLTVLPEKEKNETDEKYNNRLKQKLEELENLMTLLNEARDGREVNVGDISSEGSLIKQTYMYATTEPMLLTVEKLILENNEHKTREQFGEYKVKNMNFGIAEVPVTKIDLQKHVSEFTIVDSTGQNTIAGIVKGEDGKWIVTGDVLETTTFDVSIEDNKLQGAKLQVKYEITSNMEVELNYDNSVGVKATISELKDIIHNNLSYNPELNNNGDKNNSYYWEVSSLNKSSISDIANYNTVIKATHNALNDINNGKSVYITLEKVLSSTDSTLEDIIQSTVDIYEYENIVEITGLNYENVIPEGDPEEDPEKPPKYPQKDRIRNKERYIILPGVQYDAAEAEIITIHPPTGDSSIHTMYYVMAAIGLTVLAVGIFGIKKYVIKK